MTRKSIQRVWLPALVAISALAGALAVAPKAHGAQKVHHMVVVPEEDRFTPFAITIHSGDVVLWTNMDSDDHTVVSDDFVNSGGPRHIDRLLPGTESNGGQPGQVRLRFGRPGVFVYYCRFHSHLDDSHQPVAPGPEGGIEDANGNLGTPMMGVVTVLPGGGED
jgi:plastocyanin